ncbi:NADH:ubiquinone reductase (Na(+)-transporting) subunit F [Profundibacter sp.]|uniref:NADH:ubiquinone reductase (Na(+)-transporting) subunit F n=1 Tax=Profundibacter sp. TaxID=3101071 RepID=UPI003D129633
MSYEVTVEPLGVTIEVEEGQTLLDAALREGVYLPHACGHGLCATCKVDILEGEVEHGDASPFALMDMERDEGKCLACTATPTSDMVIEADIEEDPDARSIPVRDFSATVSAITRFSDRIVGITLKLKDGPIDFQAGQYINLHVPAAGDRPRAFSIASPPSKADEIELNVCKVRGGAATTWLYDDLTEGTALKVTGPYGRFFVRKSRPEPMIFLAGGSGLSSPKSMILELLETGEDRQITLIYGARDQADLYYYDLFSELAEKHANFTYIPVLSNEPEDSNWQGERGFVHEAAERAFDGRFKGHVAYLCGPPPMIDACITTLMQGRLFEKEMYLEHFYDESSRDDSKAKSPLFKHI